MRRVRPYASRASDLYIRAAIVLALFLTIALLSGCDLLRGKPAPKLGGSPPLVVARDQGQASLTVMSCPTPAGGMLLTEYLQSLQATAPLVVADDGAIARLVINLCSFPPSADVIRAATRAVGR